MAEKLGLAVNDVWAMNAAQYFGVLLAAENNAEAERELYERERRKAEGKWHRGPDAKLKEKLNELRGIDGRRR